MYFEKFFKFLIWNNIMPPLGFKCKQCGNCCLKLRDAFETCATEEDIQYPKKIPSEMPL